MDAFLVLGRNNREKGRKKGRGPQRKEGGKGKEGEERRNCICPPFFFFSPTGEGKGESGPLEKKGKGKKENKSLALSPPLPFCGQGGRGGGAKQGKKVPGGGKPRGGGAKKKKKKGKKRWLKDDYL